MTIKEIQEECRKRYPVGTKYICPYNKRQYEVEENVENMFLIRDCDIDAGVYKGYFYCDGKFAEIVSKPEINTKDNLILIL